MKDTETRPKWINLSNLIKVLRCKESHELLSKKITKYATKQDPIFTTSYDEDAETFFPSLLFDVRMFDIMDSIYWGVSFFG